LSLPQPDLAILRKAQRGDERAFAIIVRTYETPVYNYVLRLTNGDKALAEDLTQEVFLRVFQGLPRFSLRCKFTTWLFQVTKNRVLDELRAKERRPFSPVNLDDAPQLEVIGLSYNEIADSLEITLATVKWRIFKAREDVQVTLARHGITFDRSAAHADVV
jgi:RNA polymerase sigma-70 factor, ECF subfamily